MKLSSLTLWNFRTFIDKVRFVLDKGPVFVYLHGENKYEPRLGANGVGKSSLWLGLQWVLYGKTVEGLSAGKLNSWIGEKGYGGKVVFYSGKIRHIVKRTWNPNSLTLDGKEVEQRDLTKLLGVDLEVFRYSILMAQGEKTFLDLSPGDKMKLFSSVLNLERWIEYSNKAKNKSQELTYELGHAREACERLKGKIEGRSLKEWKQAVLRWDREQDSKKKSLVKDIEQTDREVVELTAEENRVRRLRARARTDKVDSDKQWRRQKDFLKKHEKVLLKRAAWVSKTESREEQTKAILDKLTSLTSKVECPVCKTPVNKKHIAQHVDRTFLRLRRNKEEARKARNKFNGLQRILEESRKSLYLAERRERHHAEEFRKASTAMAVVQNDLDRAKRRLAGLWKERARLKEEKNPHLAALTKVTAERGKWKLQLKRKKHLVSVLNQEIDVADFWADGFKKVRLRIVDQLLRHLEISTNNIISKLGMSGWSVEYAVQRETKSGTISQGFDVLVKSPQSSERVPFEAWSGGERQRLRIAGQMAFMDLVSFGTMGCNLEVYDEPTSHLSFEGVEKLLEVLKERARENNKTIVMSAHHRLINRIFDIELKVIRDKHGSRLCTIL